ncbi:MAG TPA: tetratricopeptide repeat protein [Kofleriaceae bacterium]|jgi:tetratricopeptide (TPR) repeat protein|nr:tetratricopeptide repeat protein [Kofleriaceae bacterium]
MPHNASADDKTNAKALLQQGVELYRASKYEDAIAALKKSYQLDPQYDALYALAQAERLGGHCPDALVHYREILEKTTEPSLAGAVKNNMDLCVTGDKPEHSESTPESPPMAVRAAPRARTSVFGLTLVAGGSVLLGSSLGLLMAASQSQDSAANAPDYDTYLARSDRAGTERGVGYAFIATGAVAFGAGVYVLLRRPKDTSPTVSASVGGGTASVLVQGRW